MKKPLIKIKDCIKYMESIDYNFTGYYPKDKGNHSLYEFNKRGGPYHDGDMIRCNDGGFFVPRWTMTAKDLRRMAEYKLFM